MSGAQVTDYKPYEEDNEEEDEFHDVEEEATSSDSDDGLMNETLGITEFEHGSEHGAWAW